MEKIFDIVRSSFVIKTPEEEIRQQLLSQMIYQLGYPKSFLSVEKNLSKLPHLQNMKKHDPNRRVDILCFAKDIHPSYDFYPLLLIECKAVMLDKTVFKQVEGYNHTIQAFFYAVKNQDQFFLFWENENKKQKLDFLPSYKALIEAVKQNEYREH